MAKDRDQDVPDDFTLLWEKITNELGAQSALRELGLSEELARDLAYWIAVNVAYGFEVHRRRPMEQPDALSPEPVRRIPHLWHTVKVCPTWRLP